jgi:N-succinyldiaminopimelate aminotransferase
LAQKAEVESAVCEAFRPYGTTIFTEMTTLANKSGAVNLSQGFPDFDGPEKVRRAAADAIMKGPNQYVHSAGVPALRKAVADKMKRFYGIDVDPETQVTVAAGASETLAATLLGILEPGDEVILLEPCYDLYPPMIGRAGARAIYVPLSQPEFVLPKEDLRAAFNERTRAIVINNPLNPCGKVFSREELEFVGGLCEAHDVVAIGDEVYEHLVFGDKKHVTLLDVPVLKDRSIVISSTAKTFSMTGWKVGYAVACERLSLAVRMSHQFISFCTPGAFQEAMALAIAMDDKYYDDLLADYTRKRQMLCGALEEIGFDVLWPQGTYYASIDISKLDFEDDMEFCRYLATDVGVAAIPSSYFWKDRRGGRELVRFCFCKKDTTLEEAVGRLRGWNLRK